MRNQCITSLAISYTQAYNQTTKSNKKYIKIQQKITMQFNTLHEVVDPNQFLTHMYMYKTI